MSADPPIPAEETPVASAITPDGRLLLVVNAGLVDPNTLLQPPGEVIVINTATNSRLGLPILVGGGARAIAITPDGKRAYVAAHQAGGTVTVIDIETQQIVGQPIPVGAVRARDRDQPGRVARLRDPAAVILTSP